MQINKLSEIWLLWVMLGVIVLAILQIEFINDSFIVLFIVMIGIDLITRILRGTIIRNRRIRDSVNIVTEFNIQKESFFEGLVPIIIFLVLFFTDINNYRNMNIKEVLIDNSYIWCILYFGIDAYIKILFSKKNNVVLTEKGVIFPTGTYFPYSSIKSIQLEPYVDMYKVNISAKGSFGRISFRISQDSLCGINELTKYSLD